MMNKKVDDKGTRATSFLWPEERIMYHQGFPTWGSQGHLAEGLHSKQSNWGYPEPMGFPMEDSQVEGDSHRWLGILIPLHRAARTEIVPHMGQPGSLWKEGFFKTCGVHPSGSQSLREGTKVDNCPRSLVARTRLKHLAPTTSPADSYWAQKPQAQS